MVAVHIASRSRQRPAFDGNDLANAVSANSHAATVGNEVLNQLVSQTRPVRDERELSRIEMIDGAIDPFRSVTMTAGVGKADKRTGITKRKAGNATGCM